MQFFPDFPSNSRVWVYQADRPLTSSEGDHIRKRAEDFISQWAAHGKSLRSSLAVFHDRFIVLCVDLNVEPPSGCSIDASVHFVQDLQKELDVSFFDRMQVAYRTPEGIAGCSLDEFREKYEAGAIGPQTPVFNNLVNTKEDLENNWEIPLEKSWHMRLLSQGQKTSA